MPDTTLGSLDWGKINEKIDEKIADTVALLHPCPVTRRELVKCTLAPDVHDTLTRARQFMSKDLYFSSKANVKLSKTTQFNDVDFGNIIAPGEDFIVIPHDMREVLDAWVEDVLKVWQDWMVVRHVADWFNDNASLGAMRYYWPCIMGLLPPGKNLDLMHQNTLGKYKEPKNISKMLPLCRTTATLVTSGQMLPERDKDDKRSDLILAIDPSGFNHVDYTGQTHVVAGTRQVLYV